MRPLHKLILLLAIAANDAYRNQIVRQGVQHDSHLTHTYYEVRRLAHIPSTCTCHANSSSHISIFSFELSI
ncbi:hypothetical protein B484DRAFT_447121 [Ochromonadaceae sp. CCMP2298]|nr:hypothetical protein B484DRAFT_447121 [Ochromonadaceae sp. CCMP2298]